jgi:hypothetical protein
MSINQQVNTERSRAETRERRKNGVKLCGGCGAAAMRRQLRRGTRRRLESFDKCNAARTIQIICSYTPTHDGR